MEINTIQAFGKWLKAARKAAGLTQAELGERVGRTAQAISLYERGHSEAKDGRPIRPDLDVIDALARATGLRFHDLRHSFATDLLEAGVNERLAMKLTGHSTEQMHAVYTNVDDRLASVVAASLDALHVSREKQAAES